jgi:hypothetical protein
VNIGTARSLPLPAPASARSPKSEDVLDAAALLSRREATLRSAATACLVGIALVQAIGLPFLLRQEQQLAVLSIATMAVCVGLGLMLAATTVETARQMWRAVAAAGVLVLVGWAAPRLVAVPDLTASQGKWTAMPGALCAVFAVVVLGLSVTAQRPTRGSIRGLLTAAAVMLALAPGAGVLVVATGPGTFGGETVLSAGAHIHSHGSPENAIVFQALPGGNGGHYVYKTVAAPRQTGFEVALIVAAGLIFVYGAVGFLRRRVAEPDGSERDTVDLSGAQGGTA